jgi:hypothetical protein
MTEIVKIYNEIGGYDICECEVNSTRVLRVIDSSNDRLAPDTIYDMYRCLDPEVRFGD